MKFHVVLVLFLGCTIFSFASTTTPYRSDEDILTELRKLGNGKNKPATTTTPEPVPTLPEGCGIRQPSDYGLRMTSDSEPAEYTEFKWTVAIFNDDNNTYHCVGSLIHPAVVLTVAHRFAEGGRWTVHAGRYYITQRPEFFESSTSKVKEVVVHPEYNPIRLSNDIALLFLERQFEASPNIGFLCLPPAGHATPPGTKCIVAGWGHDKYVGGKPSEEMKVVELPIVGSRQCQRSLRPLLGVGFELHKSMLCAGGEEGRDACLRDGGAALACPYESDPGRYYQAGAVSWGLGCGRPVPAVYTDTQTLRAWIDRTMAGHHYSTSYYTRP